MNEKFRSIVKKLDTAGLHEREEQRVRKQQQQPSAEEYRRSFDSAFADAHRRIDLRKLAASDPAAYFFLTANRNFRSA